MRVCCAAPVQDPVSGNMSDFKLWGEDKVKCASHDQACLKKRAKDARKVLGRLAHSCWLRCDSGATIPVCRASFRTSHHGVLPLMCGCSKPSWSLAVDVRLQSRHESRR
ncbi:hypothetical protein CYMTET_33228 [Cymbomonas tetramitiformis]|uniref:Uncharacterized protein n=1 Tax=Cymbomonas tetramitiformis TaxID=36881 RepID=A0AAE0FDJ5_9CHLO|nr:hypothetical protein CYMTET_33228 [Cymbomonas tetramitiformis]